MVRKILLFVLTGIILSSVKMIAQDDSIDTLNFEVQPIQEEKPPYFAIGGGYTATFLFLNMDGLNSHFASNNFSLPDLKSPIYMSGVHGFTAIGIVPNVRIGFMGMGGSKKVQADLAVKDKIDTTKIYNVTRGAEYSVYYTGFTLDYGFILFRSFALIPGVSGMWATATIESYQTEKAVDWTEFKPETKSNNFLNRAEGSFFYVQPYLNAEYAATPFLMVRASVGYSLSFSGTWTYNRDASFNSVPSTINTSGLTAQLGLFIGLFNY